MDNQVHKLLIATENMGKLVELQALLADLPLQLVRPSDLGLTLNVLEDGKDYAENAAKKAIAFAQASGYLALADDSGLEVDALDGRPGFHSARFHPKPGASDADRRQFLISQLHGKPQPWKAHFHCTVALAIPTGEVKFEVGRCDGEIISEERGHQGFGYDPIFWIPSLKMTMAELDMDAKNQLSHRAVAVRRMVPTICELIK